MSFKPYHFFLVGSTKWNSNLTVSDAGFVVGEQLPKPRMKLPWHHLTVKKVYLCSMNVMTSPSKQKKEEEEEEEEKDFVMFGSESPWKYHLRWMFYIYPCL